ADGSALARASRWRGVAGEDVLPLAGHAQPRHGSAGEDLTFPFRTNARNWRFILRAFSAMRSAAAQRRLNSRRVTMTKRAGATDWRSVRRWLARTQSWRRSSCR